MSASSVIERNDLTISTARSVELNNYGRQYAPLGVIGSGRHWEPYPLYIERALGSRLWDVDGNEFIDYHGAYGPAALGHNHPEIREAVVQSLESNGVLFALPHEAELRLASKITEVMPSAEKVIFTCAGTEATFHAVRVARAYTKRDRVLKFEGAYNGWHDYVIHSVHPDLEAAGSVQRPNTVPSSEGTPDVITGLTDILVWNDEQSLKDFLEVRGHEIACLIIEPIIHACGVLLPKDGFLELCRELCTEYGIVLIFDEIVTGFRHDLGGVQKLFGVTPDLTTFGKAVANGYPISGMAGKNDIMSLLQPEGRVAYQGTFNGLLMSMVAGLKTIEIMERDPVHERLFEMGERIAKELNDEVNTLGLPALCRNYGSVWSMMFTDIAINDYRTLATFTKNGGGALNDEFQAFLLDHGIYLHPHHANRCYLSYAHTDNDVDATIDTVKQFIRKRASEIQRVNATLTG